MYRKRAITIISADVLSSYACPFCSRHRQPHSVNANDASIMVAARREAVQYRLAQDNGARRNNAIREPRTYIMPAVDGRQAEASAASWLKLARNAPTDVIVCTFSRSSNGFPWRCSVDRDLPARSRRPGTLCAIIYLFTLESCASH